jgi:hypothetical protein
MILFLTRVIQQKIFTLTIAFALLWPPNLTLIKLFFVMNLVKIVSFDAEFNSTSNSTAFRLNSDTETNGQKKLEYGANFTDVNVNSLLNNYQTMSL